MYNVTPGIYTKKEAAGLAAKAFALEERNSWIVCHKTVKIDSNISMMYYKPVPQDNLKEAKEDGWVVVSFKIKKEDKCIDYQSSAIINPRRCDLAKKEDPIKLSTDFYSIIIEFRDINKSANFDMVENYCMDSDFDYSTNESVGKIIVKTITKHNANDIISDILDMTAPVHVSEWEGRKVTMRI